MNLEVDDGPFFGGGGGGGPPFGGGGDPIFASRDFFLAGRKHGDRGENIPGYKGPSTYYREHKQVESGSSPTGMGVYGIVCSETNERTLRDLKTCDFGLARVTSESDFMTGNVVNRAPELLLNSSDYTAAIDVGFMELMDREPLFPGRDDVHQLRLLMEQVGKFKYGPGTKVEVNSVLDKEETAWVPSRIVTETDEEDNKKMFIVKYCGKHFNCNGDEAGEKPTVVFSRIRPVPPPHSVKEYKLLDPVEAFLGSSWRQGLVKGILSERRYLVNLGASVRESVFEHSDLRPLMERKGGIWRNRSTKQQTVKETPSSSVRKRSMHAYSSRVKPMTPKSDTLSLTDDDTPLSVFLKVKPKAKEPVSSVTPSPVTTSKPVAGAVTNDDDTPSVIIQQVKPLAATPVAETGEKTSFEKTLEQVKNQKAMESDLTQVKPIAVSSVTPFPVITASPLKQPVAETGEMTSFEKTLEQVRNQLETATTQQKMHEEENSKEESRKRKRDQEQDSNLNETVGTCNGSSTEIDNTTSKKICNDGDVSDQPLSSLIERSTDQTPNMVKSSSVAMTHVDETRGEDRVTSLPFAKKSPYWKTFETFCSFKTVPQRPHFSPLCDAKEDLREWSAVGMMVTFYGLLDEVKGLELDDPPSKQNGLSVALAELEKHGFEVEAAQSRIWRVMSIQEDRKMNTEEKKCLEEKIEEQVNEMRKVDEELERLQAVAKEKKEEGEKKMVGNEVKC